jgi:hypothetical protein
MMQIIEVSNESLGETFIKFPVSLYKGDPNYIRPLDDDIRKIFDPSRNKYFRHGEATRFLLQDDKGKYIGRIAAFINHRNAKEFPQITGYMGFFECINNQEAANMLFDAAKNWLAARGMQAMNGPVNFGERNQWWGLLVDGFTPPCYGMNYNPPYYKQLLENYGFQVYFYQYSYGLNVNDPRPEKYYEKSRKLLQDKGYRFEHIDFKKLDKQTQDFRTIFNKAFAGVGREGVKPLTEEQATNLVKALKPVMVDYLMWLGYYHEEPIALFFMIPDLNGYIKYMNGKMNWIGKLKYLYHKLMKTNRKMFGFLFGVVPEFQHKGVEGAIIIAADSVVRPKKRWDTMELTWIGDFNPRMMRIAENLGAKIVKTHATYRYIFDKSIPFQRYPIED